MNVQEVMKTIGEYATGFVADIMAYVQDKGFLTDPKLVSVGTIFIFLVLIYIAIKFANKMSGVVKWAIIILAVFLAVSTMLTLVP